MVLGLALELLAEGTLYYKIMQYPNGSSHDFEMNVSTNSDVQTEQGTIIRQSSGTYYAVNGQTWCVIKYNVQQDEGHPDTIIFTDVVFCATQQEADAESANGGYKDVHQTVLNGRYNFHA